MNRRCKNNDQNKMQIPPIPPRRPLPPPTPPSVLAHRWVACKRGGTERINMRVSFFLMEALYTKRSLKIEVFKEFTYLVFIILFNFTYVVYVRRGRHPLWSGYRPSAGGGRSRRGRARCPSGGRPPSSGSSSMAVGGPPG